MVDGPDSLAMQGLSYYNGAEFISDLSPCQFPDSMCGLVRPRWDTP